MDLPRPMEPGPEDGDGEVVGPGPAPEPEARALYPARGTSLLGAAMGFALSAFAIWGAIRGPSGDSALEVLVGRVLFGLVGAYGVVLTVRRLTRPPSRDPALVLGRDGILDNTALRPVFVPWEEVVSIETASGGLALEIKVRDRSTLRVSLLRRFVGRVVRRHWGADLVVPTGGLDEPPGAVAALVHAWNESRLLREVREARKRIAPSEGPRPEGTSTAKPDHTRSNP